ncbi:MAG: DNA-directed RNA polymerase subunit alpha, partial [Lentisphaeria bacterium]|nr:DNA-directed RNA polymerase subunit alpha [Lentisphaeria bacterium]
PAEKNKRPDHPEGTIPVDSLFSPVVHVSYSVGAARVGEETEMDSLILEVETDGRISPKDALEKAALILKDHLRPFLGDLTDMNGPKGKLSGSDLLLYPVLIRDVEVLELSVRAMNCLNNANIKLLGELCMKSESRMLKFRNFGKKSLEEIKEKLAENNLSLGMTFSEELSSAITAEADRAKAVKKEEA